MAASTSGDCSYAIQFLLGHSFFGLLQHDQWFYKGRVVVIGHVIVLVVRVGAAYETCPLLKQVKVQLHRRELFGAGFSSETAAKLLELLLEPGVVL
jgi:hypothetical protein